MAIAPPALVAPPAAVTVLPPVRSAPPVAVAPPAVVAPPAAVAPPVALLLLPELTQATLKLAASALKRPRWVAVRKKLLFC